MNWAELYIRNIAKSGGYSAFVNKKVKQKRLLLNLVIRYAGEHGPILEAGCGSGATSSYLASKGFIVEAIDNDIEMLKLSKKISSLFNKKPKFRQMNIIKTTYKNKFFKVTFSQGVLEHFQNKDIIKIINEQLRISEHVIISIPSDYFSEKDKMYGNERFMNIKKWKAIIKNCNGEIIDTFGYYYDGPLRTATIFFPHALINYAPYIGFVLKSKSP